MHINETTLLILSYFALTGVVSVFAMEAIIIRNRPEIFAEHSSSVGLRRFFYFMLGGAIIPLLVLIVPAGAAISFFAEKRQQKLSAKKASSAPKA